MSASPSVWVIDTSSVIEIRALENRVKAEVYERLTVLVSDGRLRYPKQVVDELKRGGRT